MAIVNTKKSERQEERNFAQNNPHKRKIRVSDIQLQKVIKAENFRSDDHNLQINSGGPLLGRMFCPVFPLFKEGSTNSTSTVEQGEESEDNFDPYLFIKRLPHLSEIVAPCRRLLLPRQTRSCPPVTLVLDLDETLVHTTLDYCKDADYSFTVDFNFRERTFYVRRRPHLQMFLERVAQLFEITVFTASHSIYAKQILNILDPKRKLIRHRIFRESCVFVDGNYLKDLSILGRDLSKTAIIDNSPHAFGFQVDNGIPIESWFDDRNDCALATLLPFLESLAGVDDVRPIIAKMYNLRHKVAAAA